MRVMFMGTPSFAVPTLRALMAACEVVGVYCRPDHPSGRGRRLVPSAVKTVALGAGIPVFQPARLSGSEEVAVLAGLAPDLIVVAAYGVILPAAVLEIPERGCVNVHASLLPRWRGAAPIQRAILAGDLDTGVSIMKMEEGLDTGPFCARMSVAVDDKDAACLSSELAVVGARAIMAALPGLSDGSTVWEAQDDAQATYAAKLVPADVALDPTLMTHDLLRRVRASGPSAPCRVTVGDRRLTVLQAAATDVLLAPGVADCAKHLDLGCMDGTVRLISVVPEGRAAMRGEDFVRGARLGSSCTWSAS
jgi:methionyl-tRNA formyltransferase